MTSSRSLLSLPAEIILMIPQFLPREDTSRLSRTCQTLYWTFAPQLWSELSLRIPAFWKMESFSEEAFRHVDDDELAERILTIVRSPRPVLDWVKKLHLVLEKGSEDSYLPWTDDKLQEWWYGYLDERDPRLVYCMVPSLCSAMTILLRGLFHLKGLRIDSQLNQYNNPVRSGIYGSVRISEVGIGWDHMGWSFEEIFNILGCLTKQSPHLLDRHILQLVDQYRKRVVDGPVGQATEADGRPALRAEGHEECDLLCLWLDSGSSGQTPLETIEISFEVYRSPSNRGLPPRELLQSRLKNASWERRLIFRREKLVTDNKGHC